MKSVLLIAIVLFTWHTAAAQEQIKPADSTDPSVSERIRLLESELERQNGKLDQLQKTIADQQLAIQALLEKLSAKEIDPAPTATAAAPAEPQTQPNVEQRLAKVEGDVKKIGPIRLSGDFRLRFDGIFRRATRPPDPPLDHQQNA
ncbi:MAG TPA: hypothetical protein VHH35_13955, partial [Pyrinomonadaceae bacterium]|nr:hypothetical protein [Pyrinomonadaceae bacterium]